MIHLLNLHKGEDMQSPGNALAVIEASAAVAARPLLSDLIERFLRLAQVRLTSARMYRAALLDFNRWAEGRPINEIRFADIVAYITHLRTRETRQRGRKPRKVSPLTVNAYLTALKRFFEFLERETNGLIKNVAADVKGEPRRRGMLKDGLTADQARRMLDLIDRSTAVDLRDYAVINLMLRTGLRSVEVAQANIEDIRERDGQLVLWIRGKGRSEKDDFVILTDKADGSIRDYLAARGAVESTEPLFASHSNNGRGRRLTTYSIQQEIVCRRLRDAGLKTDHVTCHSLRHTAAMLALTATDGNVVKVQAMMRHSDINTTMVYLSNRNRVRDGAEHYIDF